MGNRVVASIIVATILGTVGWVWAMQADVTRQTAVLARLTPMVEEHDDTVANITTDVAVIRERVTSQGTLIEQIHGKLDALLFETRRANGH